MTDEGKKINEIAEKTTTEIAYLLLEKYPGYPKKAEAKKIVRAALVQAIKLRERV